MAVAACEIPPITDPMGKYWQQPDRSRIVIDDTHALMDLKTFEELAEYSCSQPSGVYEGKMWKRHNGIYDRRFIAAGGVPNWMLCWYGSCDDPSKVSNNYRDILIATQPQDSP